MNDSLSIRKKQLNTIRNGKGIAHILEKSSRILGNPILLHDMEYKVITCTENTVTDDPIWNEFEANGRVGSERLLFYQEECFFELCANAKKVTFLLSDRLKYNRIYGKLFTKYDIQIGCACLVACYQPLEEDSPALFEIVCDILSKEFSMIKYFQTYGQTYQETLVTQLIENNIKSQYIYLATIESIYMNLKSIIRFAVAGTLQDELTYSKLSYLRDLLKQARPDFKYAVYSNYIVFFMSSDDEALRMGDLRLLHEIFEQKNMFAGISNCFENLIELSTYYNEALEALNYLFSAKPDHHFCLYEDIPSLCLID